MWNKLVSFTFAVLFHAVMLALWLSVETPLPKKLPTLAEEGIIQAVTVTENEVMAEMQRLQKEEVHRNQAELAKQQELEHKKLQAEEAVVREQTRKQQEREVVQREAEERQRLEQLKQKQQQEELERIKQEKTKIAAAKAKQREEAERQAQLEAHIKAKKAWEAEKRRERELAVQRKAEQKAAREKQRRQEAQEEIREEKRKAAKATEAKRQADEAAKAEKAERAAREAAAEAKRQAAARRGTVSQERINQVKTQIQRRVRNAWVKPGGVSNGLSCVIHIRLIPGGAVGTASIVQGSGNSAFDASALTAVRKASPLPVPADIFDSFRSFQLRFSP